MSGQWQDLLNHFVGAVLDRLRFRSGLGEMHAKRSRTTGATNCRENRSPASSAAGSLQAATLRHSGEVELTLVGSLQRPRPESGNRSEPPRVRYTSRLCRNVAAYSDRAADDAGD